MQLGHTDGGRLVQLVYGHPSEERAWDRLGMAFAVDDGHNRPHIAERYGHISDASA